jgi:hypothetical protein
MSKCKPGTHKVGGRCVKSSGSVDTWGRSGDITVGRFSEKTLENIRRGKDRWAMTVFMNGTSFSQDELRVYPYFSRREYSAQLDTDEDEEPIKFYATDDEMAKKFLDTQYDTKKYPIISLIEYKTSHRTVM